MLSLIIKGAIIGGAVYNSQVRIPVNHLGLPISIFTGRFKDKDNHVPIHPPYEEGWHLKPFWWKVLVVDQSAQTRRIEKRAYPANNGTVLVSGLVEWRYSKRALFRVTETKQSIEAGLDALIDDLLSKEVAGVDVEDCVTRKGELNTKLRQKLTKESDLIINGERLSESEKKYGIEILTVHISLVELPPDLEEARNEEQREQYERQAQNVERTVLEKDVEVFTKLGADPDLALKMAMQRQGKLPDGMTDERLKVDVPDGLGGLVGALVKKIGGRSKK